MRLLGERANKKDEIEQVRNDLWKLIYSKIRIEPMVLNVVDICNKYENNGEVFFAVLTSKELNPSQRAMLENFHSAIPVRTIEQNRFHDLEPGARFDQDRIKKKQDSYAL